MEWRDLFEGKVEKKKGRGAGGWQEGFGLDGSSPVNRSPLSLSWPHEFHDLWGRYTWMSAINMLIMYMP